jgi:hypothetical protein
VQNGKKFRKNCENRMLSQIKVKNYQFIKNALKNAFSNVKQEISLIFLKRWFLHEKGGPKWPKGHSHIGGSEGGSKGSKRGP